MATNLTPSPTNASYQPAGWRIPALLAIHAVLLLQAATAFTLLVGESFTLQYFCLASQTGFSRISPYVSEYSLPVVLTYVAAHAVGLIAYGALWRSGWRVTGMIGGLLCAAGLASFGLEATHWMTGHHKSLIVSVPGISIPLAIGVCVAWFATQSHAASD